jgi:hypothetical protein
MQKNISLHLLTFADNFCGSPGGIAIKEIYSQKDKISIKWHDGLNVTSI